MQGGYDMCDIDLVLAQWDLKVAEPFYYKNRFSFINLPAKWITEVLKTI